MIVEEIADFLAQAPAFRLVGREELRELAERVQVEFSPAGTALLTRPGSTHSLKQTGKDDLVVLITYLNK